MIIINPDNPSGNYISYCGIMKIIDWCKTKNISFILDESFVDFADETDNTLITEDILVAYDNLYVVKSISKSYGVPGLRLGVLASGNCEIISKLKTKATIWNINSFAEFFMQIFEKYKKEYEKSLEDLRFARKELIESLEQFEQLEVFSSQANYILCEVRENSSHRIAVDLLRENILIKDVTSKTKNGKEYIRVAIRTREDNKHLIEALRRIL